MKIIKSGKKPEDKEATCTCMNCKCEFSFKASEGKLSMDQRGDGNAYTVACPECNYSNWVAASSFK